MELSRFVRGNFCDYEFSYRPMYKNLLGFFEQEIELKFLWCLSEDFENLQKPDKDCDEWEMCQTESFIASREEENAIDPKFGMKKFDKTAPLSRFSTETGQDAKEEVQEASAVKNTSLKSVGTNLSTI